MLPVVAEAAAAEALVVVVVTVMTVVAVVTTVAVCVCSVVCMGEGVTFADSALCVSSHSPNHSPTLRVQ